MAFTFIDLFAGIGGFHIAGNDLGGKCVFASEIEEKAREVYRNNFFSNNPFLSKNFNNDIKKVNPKEIPSFEFLFAGFPCQPFSKGGQRLGFKDERGGLFQDIIRIIKDKSPKYFLLENVSNLVTHDNQKTFKKMNKWLKELGYVLNSHPLVLSPDMFGIPVLRKRVYITGIRKDQIRLNKYSLRIKALSNNKNDIFKIIDSKRKANKYYISEYEKRVLNMWDKFYKNIDLKIIGFPIWFDVFYDNSSIQGLPIWKQTIIKKNKQLYYRNKSFIDEWTIKHKKLEWVKPTHRKMEWQAGDSIKSLYQGIIQFRPSGIRIRRPDKFSTLVAMNHAQIIGKYERRITPEEAKRLQSFPDWFDLHKNDKVALKQLGNSVNVDVVKLIIQEIFSLV